MPSHPGTIRACLGVGLITGGRDESWLYEELIYDRRTR